VQALTALFPVAARRAAPDGVPSATSLRVASSSYSRKGGGGEPTSEWARPAGPGPFWPGSVAPSST
jgi:hypothetical protein